MQIATVSLESEKCWLVSVYSVASRLVLPEIRTGLKWNYLTGDAAEEEVRKSYELITVKDLSIFKLRLQISFNMYELVRL